MSSPLIEILLPSLIVTLFAVGCLTVVLRRNAFQAMLGVVLVAWTPVMFLAEIGARSGNPEGSALAVSIVLGTALQAIAGFFIIQSVGESTGDVDLEE
jgi:multisubunit Na+/H+ antiporter MnhC subunit